MTAADAGLPPLAPRAWLRWDVVDRLVAELRPATVLEIGCGQGSMGARLARRADYLAVEPDPTSYAVAATRVAACGGAVLPADHTGVPAGRHFDLVCAFEVLEHLEDDAAALADWVSLVRPGGHLMLSVPAFARRYGPMDARVGHYRRYDPDELAARLVGAGLVDPRVQVYGWPLGYALEAVRNRMDARHLPSDGEGGPTPEERTAASGRHQPPGGGPMDARVGHYRRYDPDELAARLVGAGLVDPRVQVYGWPLGYALEAVRNRMDARHLPSDGEGVPTPEERTAASGRHQQPGGGPIGRGIELATLPFRRLQRLAPTRGTGLVAVATRPAG